MEKIEELDKDSKKRLKKLEKDWDHVDLLNEKLTAFDLRLLLENFQPLRELVRSIGAAELQTEHSVKSESATTKALPMTEMSSEDSEELKKALLDLADLKRESNQTQNELTQCTSKVRELLKEKDTYKQQLKDLRAEYKQLLIQLQQTQADLTEAQTRCSAEPALAFLRSDLALAQTMDLANLPTDDTQALIQIVAVLAQFDNLKRLWEALKDRCEADKRAVTDNEHALLKATLAWYNHNWRSLPLSLSEVDVGSRYDYETHLRSRHATKGEAVAVMYLPGIADGNGKPLCKPLVQTK